MIERGARVYLDHNATSPLRPEARRAMLEALEAVRGNASSIHAEGRAARARIEQAREQVASLVGARASEIVFTGGGSESIAAAMRGACDRAPAERRRIVVSAIEHSAVLASARLAGSRGFEVVEIPCERDGRVDPERFEAALGPSVAIAALQWANNETGVLQPVEAVGAACESHAIPFLVDAVQAAGKIALDARRARASLLALSAHKIGGPQGAGALVVREGVAMVPLVPGGGQERRRRGGTEAVAALAGFGAAAEAVLGRLEDEGAEMLALRERIESALRSGFPGARVHGAGAPRLPNTVNFGLPEVPGETLVIALDVAGFAISTGSACSSGAVEPSHVIRAMGFGEAESRAAVRVSLGWSTTAAEVEAFLASLRPTARRVRERMAAATGEPPTGSARRDV